MNLSARDRKLLGVWVALLLAGGWYFTRPEEASIAVLPATATPESVGMAEQRLERLRNIAATATAKQEVLKAVTAELAQREQGLIRAETVQQAQAQMITAMRELVGLEAVEIRSMEFAGVEPFGDGYGLAPVRVQFECRMAQLVNILAGVAARTELMATRDYQIQASNPRDKSVRVTLTVVGVVPRSLVPDKSKNGKGGAGL